MKKLWFDEEADEDVMLPALWEICTTCRGDGARALHGYDVAEMCREDEDFAMGYSRGDYDTPCPDCATTGKVLEFDYSQMDPQLAERVERSEMDRLDWEAEDRAIRRAESGYQW